VGETIANFLADAEAIHRVSHAFRGSARILGAQRLAVACLVLATVGVERRLDDAEAALERRVRVRACPAGAAPDRRRPRCLILPRAL
jgi:HPt (histidine-containing phosphotransfer) domain-containing protein